MNTYYLWEFLSQHDYKTMSERYWKIVNKLNQWETYLTEWRHIVRYRKDDLIVIFQKNSTHTNAPSQHSIKIEHLNGCDLFVICNLNADIQHIKDFLELSRIKDSTDFDLKSEILDFMDDYCSIDE